MKTLTMTLLALGLFAGTARAADESSGGDQSNSGGFSLAATVGEGMYFIDGSVYRGPVSIELVPSFGWRWFKVDLGLANKLESIEIAGTNVGEWSFSFRPGARLAPPMFPLYLRVAFPLTFQTDDFDFGVMLGVGADIPLFGILGLVLEVDTTMSKNLAWGGDGVPLEFRAGLSFAF
jgi:hypothetical protein